jgi:hypothetical protein
VNSPSTPPRARSRPSAHLTRGSDTADEVLAALSSVFSAAPWTWPEPVEPEPAEPAPAEPVPVEPVPVEEAAGVEPPDKARAIPPPARNPARVTPVPQRSIRFLRSRAGKAPDAGEVADAPDAAGAGE